MKNHLLLVLIGVSFWHCNRYSDVDCVNLPTLHFKLISQKKNVSATYRQARLLSTAGYELPLRTILRPDSTICFDSYLPTGNGTATLYLSLTSTDTDTITIDSRQVTENCCTSFQPISIRFNGQETINEVDADYCHLFVKK